MNKMIYTIIGFLTVLVALFFIVTGQAKFGALASGERLERIKKSPNYHDGQFQNLEETPQLAEDAKMLSMLKEMLFAKDKRPKENVPSIKTDLHQLKQLDILVWFGHSSYFMQIDGVKVLVDPVFSGSASPFSFNIKAFEGSNDYQAKNIPAIDYLVITHDHWDHLDYETVMELKSKTGKVIMGLGVGAHFEKWGFDASQLIEMDWFDEYDLSDGVRVSCAPTRHFSGRGIKAKQSLWSSFVWQSKSKKIFIGGDGGYGTHFTKIGEKYGPFDLAILENGQYNYAWKYIHMTPEEVLLASKDLGAKRVFPVHSGKFALANHAWNEPLVRVAAASENSSIPILTPKIGEIVYLNDLSQQFEKWWEDVN